MALHSPKDALSLPRIYLYSAKHALSLLRASIISVAKSVMNPVKNTFLLEILQSAAFFRSLPVATFLSLSFANTYTVCWISPTQGYTYSVVTGQEALREDLDRSNLLAFHHQLQ